MTFNEIYDKTDFNPYAVNLVNNGYNFYMWLLLEKCFGMYVYEGLPESLPSEQIEMRLIMTGTCTVFNNKKYGLVTSYGGLSGVDKYFLPTDFVYAQPALGSDNLKLHKTCVTMYNSQIDQYQRIGLWLLIQRTARLLADFDSSINILTVNTRAIKNNVVANRQTQKAVDDGMTKMKEGEYYTINQNSILDMYKTVDWNTDKSGQLKELIDARKDTLNDFLSEIGVKGMNNKRERLVTDEVNADEQLLTVNVEDMLNWRKKGIEEINKIFNQKITVRRNEVYESSTSNMESEDKDNDDTESIS